jgi:hypothetical protein
MIFMIVSVSAIVSSATTISVWIWLDWFHQGCALKEIYDRRNQARTVASKVPLSL